MAERVLVAAVVLLVAVGALLIVAGLARPLFPVVAFGALFAGMSLFSGRALLVLTACELSYDPATGLVGWRSTYQRRGSLPVTELSSIRRDRRPGVYSLRFRDASHVEFWLFRREADVQELFGAIRAANPGINTQELYSRGGTWWRGLPAP